MKLRERWAREAHNKIGKHECSENPCPWGAHFTDTLNECESEMFYAGLEKAAEICRDTDVWSGGHVLQEVAEQVLGNEEAKE